MICTHRIIVSAIAALALTCWRVEAADTVPIGVARVDLTPDYPVRLSGYGVRKTESEGVAARIWTKALAIGADSGQGPAVLVMVENCGVPARLCDEVAARLQTKIGLKRERLVICSTHNHTCPWLPEFLPLGSLEPLPADQLHRMERYTRELGEQMEKVVLAALAARQPGRLSWAQGSVGFAKNRRAVKVGRSPGKGATPQGPVDHSLPLLCATDEQGKRLAIVVNYACHCTTLTDADNKIHGDWAGASQEFIEQENPGAMALVCIGCGADANPNPRGKFEMALANGRAVADEVKRLVAAKLQPVSGSLVSGMTRFKIPFGPLPSREEFQRRVTAAKGPKPSVADILKARNAEAMIKALDRGALPTHLDYSVTVWAFGDDLAMVFMEGEVVVDFALRLKRELDGRRLWVTAYTNGVPCYIVSRRVLAEGGYEPDSSMLCYGLPGPLAESVEEQVVGAVKSLVPAVFAVKAPAERAAKPGE